ncbi:MAG: calcium-transporting P-type ATPase, PMR1-type [Candidatus Aenigmarchaeota archaeon]|nr:calcium-transporting P-type ATPase, PMR1-type [Candidatus Aenigmarchaeota archaeon]
MRWHTKELEEVIKELKSSNQGLSRTEAEYRLKKYGANEITKKRRINALEILFRQFKSILIIILLIATAISGFMGKFTDATIIFVVVVLNTILGFAQEYKAEKAVEAMKRLAVPNARVMRDGKEIVIPASELVPGDLILLEEGDRVPADARLIDVINLTVDESALTGESVPVEKEVKTLGEVPIAERKNMVFMGTFVTYGRAKAIITDTGMRTEFGKIAGLVQATKEERTPLQVKLDKLGWQLGLIVLILTVAVFTIGIVEKRPPYDMFLVSVALAVSAVPEGLPAVVTITLAFGLRRMARRNSIIRRLSAVETLGSTTIIVSDKTGTITKNEMTVKKILVSNKIIDVSGVGYKPEGEFYKDSKKFDPKKDSDLMSLLKIGFLCNNAKLEKEDGWHIIGDPTEGALIVLAEKAGAHAFKESRIAELPFDSKRKRMSTVYREKNEKIAYVKGAPEEILKLCTRIQENGEERRISEKEKEEILKVGRDFASKGLRVLAFAYKRLPKDLEKFTKKNVEESLTFVGLTGMMDPPRKEAKEAIQLCENAGIKVVMITGDHRETATAIAKELNLLKEGSRVLIGYELDKISDDELEDIVEEVSIYARVSPEHKVRIVKALKKKNHVVAMTGDGVNDAPALKLADIGVAMGIRGTDVAKEASDMVLADDNFATIVSAVEEGRTIYDNIRKLVRFLLSANFDEIFVVVLAVLAGLPLPFLPIHILWINLLTDSFPALSLGVEPKEEDVMRRKPRDPKKGILSGILFYILAAGSLACLVTIALFTWELVSGIKMGLDMKYVEEKARTMAFTVSVFFELFFIFNCRSERHSAFKTKPFSNKYLLAAVALSVLLQLFVIHVPFVQPYFGTVPLSLIDWLKIILFAGSALVLSPRIFIG